MLFRSSEIKSRNIDDLDGMNGTYFGRDQNRVSSFATEHTGYTTGEWLKEGIEAKGYRTDLESDFDYPIKFVDKNNEVTFEDAASHVKIPFSNYQVVDYLYDEDEGVYYRWQHNGNKHLDQKNKNGDTNVQLSFKNLIIIFCNSGLSNENNDGKNRIYVGTTGTGDGWYVTNGTYERITFKKDTNDSVIHYYDTDGNELLFNRGKTFVNVVSTDEESNIEFNSTTELS